MFKPGDWVKYHGAQAGMCFTPGQVYEIHDSSSAVCEHGEPCGIDPAEFERVAYAPTSGASVTEHVAEVVPERALRFNGGKPEMHYVDMFPDALAGVCRTFEYGTKRLRNPYPIYNWGKGADYSQLYNCARRHMLAWLNGDEFDRDALADGFEISNLDFAIGNLLRLRQQIADGRTDLDDRGYRQKSPKLGHEERE